MAFSVYLADLRHNYSGVLANDCMPLGVAYIKALLDRDLPEACSRLFAYPDQLEAAMRADPPDVLMLSNYMWNECLSLRFARLAKEIRPATLVVMGGPNLCLEPQRQIDYLRAHPELDVYVIGEGEFLARALLRQFADAGLSLREFRSRDLPSCLYRRPDGEVVRSEMWEREPQLDEIPSPWLTGVLDEFFDGKLAPLFETNRGCPFACTFCVQGVRWYTKVHNFGRDRLREEIDYIGARIKAVCPSMGFLRIADSNYGMFERDIEISSWIGEAQKKYGWPTYIDATTGKNRPERVIESLEKVNGAMVIYQAVQSLDETTLKNIKRSNISTDAYEQVMIHVRGRGLRSLSDLILGLPGETLASHRVGINQLLDAGTNEMHLFQAMMLKGSELETLASRQTYGFDSRFRVLPKNYGDYAGEKVFDVDEIVVATSTMSFEDYLEARRYALTFGIFLNNSWFDDAVQFAGRFGIKPSQWTEAMRQELGEDDGVAGELLEDFVGETRNELFPTREACVEFYSRPENFARLCAGEIGDNLMYKYRVKAGFLLWPEICGVALERTHSLLTERGAEEQLEDFDAFWVDFHRFVELRHTHGATREEILRPYVATFRYDIAAWLAAGMPLDTARFRLAEASTSAFELSPDAAREVDAMIDVWGTSLKGLTKGITRVRTTSLVRHRRILDATCPELSASL